MLFSILVLKSRIEDMLLHRLWILRWDVSKDALEQNVGDVQVVTKICPMKDIPYVYCK